MGHELTASALNIDKDCEAGSGVLRYQGDVNVRGCIREKAEVKATGNILVGGAIEAAVVEAGGDLRVQGGIVGKDQGNCVAGRNIVCRFTSAARLTAGGDVEVEASMLQTSVTCSGKLKVPAGSVAGGQTSALGGVACKILGSNAGVATIVEAGVDRIFVSSAKAALLRIEEDRKRIQSVRKSVAPLLERQKKLNASQKERATELMYEADELEQATEKKLAELKRLWGLSLSRACPEVAVADIVYPGTTIRFEGMETVVVAAFKGPITFTLRKFGIVTEIAVIDQLNGTISPLPTARVDDAAMPLIRAMLDDRTKAAA